MRNVVVAESGSWFGSPAYAAEAVAVPDTLPA